MTIKDDELYLEIKKMMKKHFISTREILDKHGLYVGQPQFLFTLLKEPGLRQKDMAEKLNIQPATVNVTVKRLEKSGFLEKKFDESNRRVSRLYLTEKGKKTCEAVKDVMQEYNNKIFSVLTNEEKECFTNIVKKVNSQLND